jgi:hypothetical protein
MPLVQAQVGVAVLPGEQADNPDILLEAGFCCEQQCGTQAMALPVGSDNKAADLSGGWVSQPDPNAGRQSSALADSPCRDVRISQLCAELIECLSQWRHRQIAVGLRLGHVCRALERQDLADVINAQAQGVDLVYGHAGSV